ncbi:MAG: prolyl oligopeptidase family serine peptidase [Candidatus Obscuribacterales bacterium]|nr:prolyl oligopeptidase family serine peptidase [Candidatus Obscuribacterales bacterium]
MKHKNKSVGSQKKEEALYQELRRDGDAAWRKQDWLNAHRCYLEVAETLPSLHLNKRNRCVFMFAGAAYACICQKKFRLALLHIRQAFESAQRREPHYVSALNYIAQHLIELDSYKLLKNTADLASAAQLRKEIRSAIKSEIDKREKSSNEAPQRRGSYKLGKERIFDPYLHFENYSAACRTWLEDLASLSALKTSYYLLGFTLPDGFWKSCRSESHAIPWRIGKYFYIKSKPSNLQHAVFYRTSHPERQTGRRLIFDANNYIPEGHFLAGYSFSRDGKKIAIGISKGGSDWQSWKIINLASGTTLKHFRLRTHSTSMYFANQGEGLFFQKPGRKSKDGRLIGAGSFCYKALKPGSKTLTLVKARTTEGTWISGMGLSGTSYMLVREVINSSLYPSYYLSRKCAEKSPLLSLFDEDGPNIYLGNIKEKLCFLSYQKNDRGEIITLTLDKKELKQYEAQKLARRSTKLHALKKTRSVLIAAGNDVIKKVLFSSRYIFVLSLKENGSQHLLSVYSHAGKLKCHIDIPHKGFVSSLSPGHTASSIIFQVDHFDLPSTTYHHNLVNGRTTVLKKNLANLRLPKIEKKLVQVQSRDGKKIPLWLTYLKKTEVGRGKSKVAIKQTKVALKRNNLKKSQTAGNTPLLMNVYGGFNVECLPAFNYESLNFLEMGGIVATPYLRGGGELGRNWHKDATGSNKELTFDDAVACLEYIVKEGISSPAHIAVQGGSNGGLTTAVLMQRAPHLYRCSVLQSGLFDMLRFASHTIGPIWQAEYGNPQLEEDRKVLKNYSPYYCCLNPEPSGSNPNRVSETKLNQTKSKQTKSNQTKSNQTKLAQNIQNQNKRGRTNWDHERFEHSALICLMANDDRVPPWHSYKLAAALSKRKRIDLTLRIESNGGHNHVGYSWLVRDVLAYLKEMLWQGNEET